METQISDFRSDINSALDNLNDKNVKLKKLLTLQILEKRYLKEHYHSHSAFQQNLKHY